MNSANDFQMEIINNQDVLPVDEQHLLILTEKVLTFQKVDQAIVNVLLVDNQAIHEINNEFLQHDFPTDVITFPMNEASQLPEEQLLEGEIVISAEMANEMAQTVGWQPINEISLYLIHGLLHLCGYDDLKQSDQIVMRQKERELLLAAGISPQTNDPRWQDLK